MLRCDLKDSILLNGIIVKLHKLTVQWFKVITFVSITNIDLVRLLQLDQRRRFPATAG